MGIRFRKRITVLPGVKINLSKSGVSTTIGGKGASVNIGKKGIYGNAGIPGTGIYMREKISGKKSNKQINQKYNNYQSVNSEPVSIDENTEQSPPSTAEAWIGCSSVVICFVAGIIIGVKTDIFILGVLIAVLPFIVILIAKSVK